MFDKFLYNLGKKLVAKHNPHKHESSTKCPACNTWSRDLDKPFTFVHHISEAIQRNGQIVHEKTGEIYQCCSQCGSVSHWHYGLAPVAICLGFTPSLSVFSETEPYLTEAQIQERIEAMANEDSKRIKDKQILRHLPDEVIKQLRNVKQNELGKSPRNKL